MSTQFRDFKSVISGVCVPSLEDICMLTIIKHITEVEADKIKKIFDIHYYGLRPWQKYYTLLPNNKFGEIVAIYMSSISIPEVIEAKFISLVQWIVHLYDDWIFKHKTFDAVELEVNGMINYQQSVHRLLIKNIDMKIINHLQIFKIACEYCLEDDIQMLWTKLSPTEKQNILDKTCTPFFLGECLEYFWGCMMTQQVENFVKFSHKYMKQKCETYKEVIDFEISFLNNPFSCGFALALLEENPSAIKYFYKKLTIIDEKFLAHLLEIFLKNIKIIGKDWQEPVHALFLLLNQIKDIKLIERIFDEYFKVFLILSGTYWPCFKFLDDIVHMSSHKINHKVYYDIVIEKLNIVQGEARKFELMKKLWKVMSSDSKKLFCNDISTKKDGKVVKFWEEVVTNEVIDMFLGDSTNVLTPYKNAGIISLLSSSGKLDIINHWLEKCLLLEKDKKAFMNDFILKETEEIFKRLYSVKSVSQFIDLVFKYEDFIEKNEVLRIKNEAFYYIKDGGRFWRRGVMDRWKDWEDLEKFINWISKETDSQKYKLNDVKLLLGIIYSKNHLQYKQEETCEFLLKEEKMNPFFRFLNKYDVDVVYNLKLNFFNAISLVPDEQNTFEKIEKVLYWNSENDPKMKMKVWNIRQLRIFDHAFDIIDKLKLADQKLINILNCLFKEGLENTGDAYAGVVLNYKRMFLDSAYSRFTLSYNNLNSWLIFLNLGKNNKRIRKEMWNTKNDFIKIFKEINLNSKEIAEIIVGEKKSVIPLIFEDHENEVYFIEILWNMKEFLIMDLIKKDNDEYEYISQIFVEREQFNKFLNCYCFDETKLKNLKSFILNEKAVDWCLHWVLSDKLTVINNFLEWCFFNDPVVDLKIVKLKADVLKKFIANLNLQKWEEECMKKLENFLILQTNDVEKVMEESLFKTICVDLICQNKTEALNLFLKNSSQFLPGKIFDLKKSVLAEFSENLSLICPWVWLESFLDHDFDLENEQSKVMHLNLKKNFETYCLKICYDLFKKNKYNEVDEFLKTVENQKLMGFKSRLIENYGPDYCNARIGDDDWEKFEKFLKWCYESDEKNNELEEKIINLKIKTLKEKKSYTDHWEIVLRFLEWGFKSKTRLNKFKKSILVKTHPLNYLVTLKKYKSQKNFQNWFSGKK